jgi:lipoic acid synthetase
LDEGEPERLAEAVNALGLDHVVITSVTRDDLPDGGAGHYASVVKMVREQCPNGKVELLIPDFGGSKQAVDKVLAAQPDILAHNLETVPRLYPMVRGGSHYTLSLNILRQTKAVMPGLVTKSGIMLGLGEDEQEVENVLQDLREAGCDMLTIGQYLSPSIRHWPVARYVEPVEFEDWQRLALALGFKSVASGPLVRSSYKAPAFYQEIV